MSLKSKIKKAVTGVMAAALTAASIPSASVSVTSNAASDPDYTQALALSLYFDANAPRRNITGGPHLETGLPYLRQQSKH